MISLNREKNFVDDYVVFDLETTGFDPKISKIIEIGALKYRNNELVEELSILINPGCRIPDIITAITGIDDELVKDAVSIADALPQFILFIEDLPLVAHNSRFDLSFIEENILELGLPMIQNKNIDTVYLSRKYIKDVYNHKSETLKDHFGLTYSSHRSVEDCLTTNYIYQYCKNKATVNS